MDRVDRAPDASPGHQPTLGDLPDANTLADEGPARRPGPSVEALLSSARGSRFGRFRVLDKLGEGGMGVVVAAHDEQLDRRIALKFLTRARQDSVARERLIREARSLARLSHPNIVSVYEVGEIADMPYLAMELVEGQTLRAWLNGDEQHPPPNRLAILEMFLAIGRGLLAAHAFGIVHRDFKPDNVLIGADLRPRILDFGLARIAGPARDDPAEPAQPQEAPAPAAPTPDGELSLTRTGATLGTPAYMAPEQWSGAPADPRSDQFAFCVALFQAVYGRAPFAGETMHELMGAVLNETPAHIRAAERLPSGLHAALLRGLHKQGEARWPSMEPLLEQIETAVITAQPGLFDGPPPPVLRLVLPLFIGLPLSWLALELAGVVAYSVRSWALVSGLQLILVASAVTVFRRSLGRLVRDHRIFAMPFLIALFILGHRAIALTTGAPLEQMFAYDFLAGVGISSIITYLVDRRVWPVIGLTSTLTVLASLRPAWAAHLWVVFSVGLPTTVILSLMRARDRLHGEATSSPGSSFSSRSR